MKFSSSVNELKSGLQQVIGVIPTKSISPILGHILFKSENGTLSLMGSDLEVSLKTTVDAKIYEDGSVAIPGKMIFDIVKQLPEMDLEVEADENNKIRIKGSTGEYHLSGNSEEDFPVFPDVEPLGNAKFDKNQLEKMITNTIFSTSTDDLRVTLTGILFQIKADEFRAVATDGHRLVRIIDKSFTSDKDLNDIIIPKKALNLLLRNLEGVRKIEFVLGESYIVFKLKNSTIVSRQLEGKFPNYEGVIPKDNDKKLKINKDMLISSIGRISLFSNKITQQIKLALTNEDLKLSAQNIEIGSDAEEKLEGDYSGDAMNIGFNYTYIWDALKHLETENVVLEFGTSVSATLIFPSEQKENEDILMLVMPIKLADTD
ncbi:DNA polymerase III subunit beta [candidate division KSB1 bacterium]